MTTQEKNILIAKHLGFKAIKSEGAFLTLYTVVPPTEKAEFWRCKYADDDSVNLVFPSEKEAWEAHCPNFFFDEHGLLILTQWLFETKHNQVFTQGNKYGIRKAGKEPAEGAYLTIAKIAQDPGVETFVGLGGSIAQPCIAQAVVHLITRYNADKLAEKARGTTPA